MKGTISSSMKNDIEINLRKTLEHSNMQMNHYHNSYEIYYLLSGERFYFIKDRTYHVMKGDLVFINMGDLHKTTSASKPVHERLLINFKKDFIHNQSTESDCVNILDIFNRNINILRLGVLEQNHVSQLLNKIYREYIGKEEFYMMNLRALLIQLLVFMNRYQNPMTEANIKHPSSTHEKIYEAVQYINANFSDKLKLDILAQKFYFSPYYLCKMFKQVTGFSYTEYLNSVRIKESQKLLCTTDLSVSDIATHVGYDSLTHYGRVFKRITGITPTLFRKNNSS